jgi:energy-converting hydrogenase B subunit D
VILAASPTSAFILPNAVMDIVQVVMLVLVAVLATTVVLTREPVRQIIVLSSYGMMLALLFLAFQAPDVTLSELTVGAVALPILVLLALAKVSRQQEEHDREQERDQ